MELEYNLSKDDFLNFARELQHNKKLLFSFISNTKYNSLTASFFIFAMLFAAFYVLGQNNFKVFLIYLIIFHIYILLLIFFSKIYFGNMLYNNYKNSYGKNPSLKIILNQMNINVYSDKYCNSFQVSQINTILSTESTYCFIFEASDSEHILLLPKKVLSNNDDNNTFLTQMEAWKEYKEYKYKGFRTKYYYLFIIITIILGYLFNNFFSFSPKIGMTVSPSSIVSSVKEGSLADKAGFQAGDIIYEINGENVLCKTHNQITRKLRKHKNLNIKVIDGNSANTKNYIINK